jgi:FAD/FMN-containing dehydrogenase
LRQLTSDAIHALTAAIEARVSPLSIVVLHHFHGMGTRIAPDATAFGMRGDHFTMLVYSAWEPGSAGDMHRNWAANLSSSLRPFSLAGGYANLLGPDAREQVAGAYGANAARLRALKHQFDPKNVFSSAIPLPI